MAQRGIAAKATAGAGASGLALSLAAGGLFQALAGGGIASAQTGQDEPAAWLPEHAERIERNDENTMPEFDPAAVQELMPGFGVRDWWPVMTPEGEIASIDGWQVFIVLASRGTTGPPGGGATGGQAQDEGGTYHYVYTQDGSTWEVGGELFEEGEAFGSSKLAGSAVYDEDNDRVTFFYTAVGGEGGATPGTGQTPGTGATPTAGNDETPTPGNDDETPTPGNGSTPENEGTPGADEETPTPGTGTTPTTGTPSTGETGDSGERIAMVEADLLVEDDRVSFENFSEHRVILEAQGQWYADTSGTGSPATQGSFRDPYYFEDDGERYLIFAATWAEGECDGSAAVGIARADGDDLQNWELEGPILHADCVSTGFERPHMVHDDGSYYLFVRQHGDDFDQADGPEGLYGFVADDVRGDYEPLNESGLVATNPEGETYLTFSWLVLPGWWVSSFTTEGAGETGAQQTPTPTTPTVGGEPGEGSLAPLVFLEVDGNQTRLIDPERDTVPERAGEPPFRTDAAAPGGTPPDGTPGGTPSPGTTPDDDATPGASPSPDGTPDGTPSANGTRDGTPSPTPGD